MYTEHSPISFQANLQSCIREKRLDLALLLPEHQLALKRLESAGAVPILRLREKCFRGRTPAADDYSDKGISVIKVASINAAGELNRAKLSYIPNDLYKRSFTTVSLKPEDVIVVATGEGSIGNITLFTDDGPAITTGENCVIRCDKEKVDPYYLTAFLLSKYGRVQLEAHPLGPSGQTHLYPHQIDKILVATPENSHQIAAKYRQSIELKRHARQILSTLQELFGAYLAEHYSSTMQVSSAVPLQICLSEQRLDPRFWSAKAATLIEAFDKSKRQFKTIKHVAVKPIHRGEQPDYSDQLGTIPVLKTTDVQNRRINWNDCRRVTEEFFTDHPRGQLHRGDIVMTSTGEGSWGRAAIVDVERALADGHLTILNVNNELIDSYTVLAFLWSEYGRTQFEQRVRGSTGQTEIYPQDIEKIRILLPSENDQTFIREKILEQFALLDEADSLQRESIEEVERILGDF